MQAGLLLTLLALLAGGLWLHRVQAEAMRLEVERELTAIARLKAHQISVWRADQLEDVYFESPTTPTNAFFRLRGRRLAP